MILTNKYYQINFKCRQIQQLFNNSLNKRLITEMEYCENCDKTLPEHKFDLHLGYCRRNIKKCPDCNRPYDINEEEEHREEYHKKAHCQHCSLELNPKQLKDHETKCSEKPILCNYCQLSIPKQLFDEHLGQCESRTKVCEKCAKSIQNKNYEEHYITCLGPEEGDHINQTSSSKSSSYYQNSNSISQFKGTYSPYTQSQQSSYSSSYSSYQPSESNKKITIGEPRVVSRRIISGPRAGQELPINQTKKLELPEPTEEVERHQYIDPKTGVASIRTVTTKTYYRPAQKYVKDVQPVKRQAKVEYSPIQPNQGLSYGAGGYLDQSQDPQLQAALLASMGYQDENSAALYAEIQKQHQIQQQFKKR